MVHFTNDVLYEGKGDENATSCIVCPWMMCRYLVQSELTGNITTGYNALCVCVLVGVNWLGEQRIDWRELKGITFHGLPVGCIAQLMGESGCRGGVLCYELDKVVFVPFLPSFNTSE